MGWVTSKTNEQEDYFNYFGNGMGISRNWATFWPLMGGLRIVMVLLGVAFGLLMCYSEFTLRLKV